MTTAILLTNWTVYFSDNSATDGGHNQIRWTGTTGTNTVNELYSALQDEMDDNTAGVGDNMLFGTPVSAQTPTEYTIGQISPNDLSAWFIDPESIKHLTGGAIKTTGWTNVLNTTVGIFKVHYSANTLTSAEVGETVTNGTHTGILLYVDTATASLWIRPTDSSVTHDWSTISSGTITVTGGSGFTATQDLAGTTGENTWSNIYSIGTIVANTTLVVAQDQTQVTNSETSGSGAWWADGHLDILVITTDQGSLVDAGRIAIYAREPFSLYDHFVSDASGGGRNPVPLATSADSNNLTPGITTAPGGMTVAYGFVAADVAGDGSANEYYSITVDLKSTATLSDAYEYLKHLTKETQTATLNGVEGQQFTGITVRLDYTTISAGLAVGDEVSGNTGGVTGFITSINTTAAQKYVTLHNVQGDWTGETDATDVATADTIDTFTVAFLTAVKVNPFCTFAGGNLFGAAGVLFTNVLGSEANNYQVIDDQGISISPPTSVSFELTGLSIGSEVKIFNDDLTTTRDTEIAGDENVASSTFSKTYTFSGGNITYTASSGQEYTLASPIAATVIIFDVNFKEVRLSVSLGADAQSIPVQQITERNYT